MDIVTENRLNFKDIEKGFFKFGCSVACEALKEQLHALDQMLMKNRDKAVFRHKGHRKTCIKTLMGEVEYSRAIYQVVSDDNEKKFVYLLDEALGLDNIGFVSANLAERIVDNVCETSYAQTAKNISSLTGQTISHQGVWNVVQKIGSKIEEQENRYIELNKHRKLQGTRETHILFEEADGIFVKLQKRYRKKGRKVCELKIALAHEGWKQTAPKRYELAEKTMVCDITTGTKLNKRKEAVISAKYNTDEIDMRIFNSDGGIWIKKLHDYNYDSYFQLDPFHLKKALRDSDPGGEYLKTTSAFLRNGEADKLLEYLDAVANSLDDTKAEERIRKVYGYLKDNKQGIIPYQNRGLDLPKLNEGLVYRGMGNAEHNVFLAAAKRMKHRSAAWSPQGCLKLCKLLCQKASHTLNSTLENMTAFELPSRYGEVLTKPLYSSCKVQKKVGKGYEGKHTRLPFEGCALTDDRKNIMNWLKGYSV